MNPIGKTAIILGATGLTGRILLQKLLTDGRYTRVKVFSRSTTGFRDPKLEEHLGDLLRFRRFSRYFTGDEIFCCIGTTLKKSPDKEDYRKIDYGIPIAAANMAGENGIPAFIVISSMGANFESPFFYNRIKGEMENALLALNLPSTYILRPSLIGGDRGEARMGEWLAKKFMTVINPFLIGPLGKYRTIKPEAIADAMVWLANNEWEHTIVPSDEIQRIANIHPA